MNRSELVSLSTLITTSTWLTTDQIDSIIPREYSRPRHCLRTCMGGDINFQHDHSLVIRVTDGLCQKWYTIISQGIEVGIFDTPEDMIACINHMSTQLHPVTGKPMKPVSYYQARTY